MYGIINIIYIINNIIYEFYGVEGVKYDSEL